MNRAPGPTDRWWADHQQRCGGSYCKIKEPAEFTAKQAKKKEREVARKEKHQKKDRDARAARSVKDFFSMSKETDGDDKATGTARSDARHPLVGTKAQRRGDTGGMDSKKRREECREGGENKVRPTLDFPTFAPVVFSVDGDDDGYFLVGDIRALVSTSPTQLLDDVNGQEESHFGACEKTQDSGCIRTADSGAQVAGPSAVVDLTVSDSDTSENERVGSAALAKLSSGIAAGLPTTSARNADVIELE